MAWRGGYREDGRVQLLRGAQPRRPRRAVDVADPAGGAGGRDRFSEFRARLDVATDVLGARLATLVEFGVMCRESYQEPGARARDAYRLTEAGRELHVVLGSLQQWGDRYLPWPAGPTVRRVAGGTGSPVHVGFIDDQGREVPADEVRTQRTAAYPD